MDEHRLYDSSVIVAALLEGNTKAQRALDEAKTRFVLNLTIAEVANVFALKLSDSDQLKNMLQQLLENEFSVIYTDTDDIFASAKIAFENGTTVYDALYHSIAIQYDFMFYTLDYKYYQKSKDLGNITLI